MSEFHELPADDPKITIQIAVPDGRNGQICLATNLDQWVPQSTINQVLDKLTAVADRQRAKITLPGLRRELDGSRAVIEEGLVRRAQMDAGYEAQMKIYDDKERDAKIGHDLLLDRAQREHDESGKAGEFKPRGADLTKLNQYKQALVNIDTLRTKTTNEHQVARSNLVNDLRNREITAESMASHVAELEALLNGNDGERDLSSRSQPS